MIITDALAALERAARNGTRAHLEIEEVRAIIAHPAYLGYVESRRMEMIDSWQPAAAKPQPVHSSGTIGSITGPSETTGASAGTMPQLVHDAGVALASEAASRRTPRKRHARR